MKVKITRIDKSLPLPTYATKGSVAFDIYSRISVAIGPKKLETIPTNLIIATPVGYMLLITIRSSTGVKKGLTLINNVGIVDQDYQGSEDECKITLYNYTNKLVKVERGERLAQGIFLPIQKVVWREGKPSDKSRGGHGSTG